MIVTCPQCTARYKLDKNKISARGAKITCPRCRHVFVVYRDEARDDVTNTPLDTLAPDAPPPSASSGRKDASTLDFRKVGISSWKVRVKIGLVYDFSDIKTLRKYIQDGRVTSDDVISHDGKTWVTIGDIPDLDAYFIEVYERCESARAEEEPTGANEFEDDDDTNVIGMGSLGGKLAEQALAQATAEAEAELARPVSTPSPSRVPSQHGPQFVDPFAALKDKQRERIQQRRRGGGPAEKPASTGSGNLPKLAVAALLLALVGGGAWWWNDQQSSAASTQELTQPGQPPKEAKSEGVKETDGEIDKMLKEIQDEREAEKPDEPDTRDLTPVIPDDAIRVGSKDRGVKAPVETNPTVQSVNHEGDCLAAGGSGNWTAAVASCGPAMQTSGNSKVGLYYGIGLLRRGQGGQALPILESVAPVECLAHLHLGRIRGGQGDIAGANGAYSSYKQCNPADAGTADREMQDLNGG